VCQNPAVNKSPATLSTTDHDRDTAGLTYVYPVVSRRAGGVSIGVNLNPNNACNWRCAYCQVPGLARGKSPAIDLDRLEAELEDGVARGARGERRAELEVDAGRLVARDLREVAPHGRGLRVSTAPLVEVGEVAQRALVVRPLFGEPQVRRARLVEPAESQQREQGQRDPHQKHSIMRRHGTEFYAWMKVL